MTATVVSTTHTVLNPALTPLEPWIAATIGAPSPLARDALIRWQLNRLQATVNLARQRSPFYRKRLVGAPEELTSLADLALLPFTTADDLRANPLQLLCVSQDAIQRMITLSSSGTTGAPKRVAFTHADQELTLRFFQVGMSTFTHPGERVLVMLPGQTPGSVGELLLTALRRLGAEGILHDPLADPHMTAQVIAASGATVLIGTPRQAIILARHPATAGARLRSALLTTDHVPHAIVSAVEAAWGCTVYNHYGMTEMGLGGGVECQARHGYHLREADLLIEIVNPVSGVPLPEGEAGEIVFTTLTREGMPLIRYRTGDAGHFIPEACPCGTTLRTLARVTHRPGSSPRLGHALLTMADLDEALFPLEGVVGFTATLTYEASDQSILIVEIEALSNFMLDRRIVEQSLMTLPALSYAVNLGRLDLVIKQRAYDPTCRHSFQKRAIQCR